LEYRALLASTAQIRTIPLFCWAAVIEIRFAGEAPFHTPDDICWAVATCLEYADEVLEQALHVRLAGERRHAYVALAETLGCELLTADQRLASASGPRCVIRVLQLRPARQHDGTPDRNDSNSPTDPNDDSAG
jgi:hypothetical protein